MESRTSGVVTAQHGENATVAVPTRVCRAGAAASEVFLHTYISKLSGKPTNQCMMPVLSFAVISGGSRAGTCLACPQVMIGSAPGNVQNLLSWILIRPRKRQELCFSILTQSGKK